MEGLVSFMARQRQPPGWKSNSGLLWDRAAICGSASESEWCTRVSVANGNGCLNESSLQQGADDVTKRKYPRRDDRGCAIFAAVGIVVYPLKALQVSHFEVVRTEQLM